MKRLLSIVTGLHKKTKRDYLKRMLDDKIRCMQTARKFDKEFWDGDRRFGYGGYVYDGRWRAAAGRLIKQYSLTEKSKILDVGCGKGFLLYEFRRLLPECIISGFDISKYAVRNAKQEIRRHVFVHKAEEPYPFKDKEFDLVVSVTTLHNLIIQDLKTALSEIERVGKNKFIVMESYRNDRELFNLQCWALTCRSFFSVREWKWLFSEFGYKGDYEFIFFE